MINITIIGAGNLATQLGKSLLKKGYNIQQVLSRTENSAKKLAKILHAEWINRIDQIKKSDLLIIAIKDDALSKIIPLLPNIPQVHTSGNTDIDIFKKDHDSGIFYPLQTFNKELDISFDDIPICIEANNSSFERELVQIAKSLSSSVHVMDSQQRKLLHISAVFACNFSNHMISIGQEILVDNNIETSILLPLIKQNTSKLEKGIKARDLQTGPAKRKDIATINEHLKNIKDKNKYKIYKEITENIIKNE